MPDWRSCATNCGRGVPDWPTSWAQARWRSCGARRRASIQGTSTTSARQDSDLLYLTGVDQPETILVLLPGSPRRSEILFITPSNPRQEHYVGKFLTAAEARARTGIETVLLTTQFDQFLTAMFNRRPFDLAVDEARINTDHDVFFKALDEGTARGGAAARGHTGDERTVERRVRVRQPRPRTAARRPHHQPCAARACTAAGEDAIRTEAAGRKRRDLLRRAYCRHAGGATAALRAGGRIGDRSVYLARGAMSPGYPPSSAAARMRQPSTTRPRRGR